jgi:hypothetical protein
MHVCDNYGREKNISSILYFSEYAYQREIKILEKNIEEDLQEKEKLTWTLSSHDLGYT